MRNVKYRFNRLLKCVLDVFASLLGIIALSPLFAIIAIAIKLESKGPVIFKQGRLTRNGRKFMMYKFRTMVENAEHSGTGLFNYENDPRVTRVGAFLRKASLDEFPQLFNVLKGDMSLVGPRPPVTYELGDYETLNKKYKKRFEVLAGITGLAQVRGRNENSWDEKVTLDNQYVEAFKQEGVLLDIKILFETMIKVFAKKDIYEQKADSSLSDIEAAKQTEEEIIRVAHLPYSEEEV